MKPRTTRLRIAVLAASVGLLTLIATSGFNLLRSRAHLPARAVDMWGDEYDLSGLEWALFDFTHAAGCGYCVLNAAAYQQNFADAFARAGVTTFGVDIFEEQRDLVDYVKHNRIRFPILTEPDGLWADLRCPGLPGQSLFHHGRLVMSQSETLTFRNYDRIRKKILDAGAGDAAGRVLPFRPAGPLKKALNAVHEDDKALVIIGDEFPRDAKALIPGLRTQVFRTKRAGEVTEADLRAGAVYVIGSPAENAFIERLRGRTPFAIAGDALAFADTLLEGNDLLLWYCCPNPWNGERYLVVKTGTFPMTRVRFRCDLSQDFVVARRSADAGAAPMIVARGVLGKRHDGWTLTRDEVVWGVSSLDGPVVPVAACDSRGCAVPVPTAGTTPAAGVAGAPARPRGDVNALQLLDCTIDAPASWPGRFPALSAADDATCWAAWDRPGLGVFAARITGDSARVQRLSANHGAGFAGTVPRGAVAAVDAFKPAVLADGAGSCWTVWSEKFRGHYQVFAARVSPAGSTETWQVSNRTNLDQHAPSIARSDEGEVTVVWYAWEANARRLYARSWRAGSWSSVMPVPTHEASQFAWYSTGTTERNGSARFVWMQHYPTPTAIVTAPISGGRWGEPERVADAGRYPSIAFNAVRGEIRVVWQQWMTGASGSRRAGPHHNDWRLFTSASRGGPWSDPELIAECPPGRNVTPVIAVDGRGDTWVFWSHKAPAGDGGDDRETQRTWRVLCARAGEAGWQGPVSVSDGAADARSPAVTSSGRSIWVAWHEGAAADLRTVVRRIRPVASAGESGSNRRNDGRADRRTTDGAHRQG